VEVVVCASFDAALEFVLRWEGGYVNDVRDPGGETNMGISKRAYPREDIKGMTRERAAVLYKRDYWAKAGCDTLPPALALLVFDTSVNCGVASALAILRLARKAGAGLHAQTREYTVRRIVRYASLAAFKTYGTGWVRRALDACCVAMAI